MGSVSCFVDLCQFLCQCQVAQFVKNLSAVPDTRVRSLGWEDLLEEEMATHSSILAWKIPWTEEPCGLQSMGSHSVWGRTAEQLTPHVLIPVAL